MESTRRFRAQAIIIQENHVLFGYGKGIHYFIGGGNEGEETAEEAALRELREEANVNGTILLKLSQELFPNTVTFLVDIQQQVTRLGYDPEETETDPLQKNLAGIEFIPLNRIESFTEIDRQYFVILMAECRRKGVNFPWFEGMKNLIDSKTRNY